MSFTEQGTDRSAATTRKPSLMRFPSLEHLDRMNDGSPWRSTTRRRRKFRGGIGGLHRRGAKATDPTSNDVDDDDVELDRVEAIPDTSRRPARTSSGVSRTASAAARQREKQLMANRGAQPSPEPENRIYRPVKKPQPQPLPPPPLAPRLPAPIDREALRVAGEANSSAEGEGTETAASRPRRQRRRRPRGDGETPPETEAEPQVSVTRVHRPQNGSGNVGSRDTPTDVSEKPEPEISRSERRRSSRRPADARPSRRTDNRTQTYV